MRRWEEYKRKPLVESREWWKPGSKDLFEKRPVASLWKEEYRGTDLPLSDKVDRAQLCKLGGTARSSSLCGDDGLFLYTKTKQRK